LTKPIELRANTKVANSKFKNGARFRSVSPQIFGTPKGPFVLLSLYQCTCIDGKQLIAVCRIKPLRRLQCCPLRVSAGGFPTPDSPRCPNFWSAEGGLRTPEFVATKLPTCVVVATKLPTCVVNRAKWGSERHPLLHRKTLLALSPCVASSPCGVCNVARCVFLPAKRWARLRWWVVAGATTDVALAPEFGRCSKATLIGEPQGPSNVLG
jgi:hypothetical protein